MTRREREPVPRTSARGALCLVALVVLCFGALRTVTEEVGANVASSDDGRTHGDPGVRRGQRARRRSTGWSSVLGASEGTFEPPDALQRDAGVKTTSYRREDAAPIDAERDGHLVSAHTRWSAELEDLATSREVASHTDVMLSDFGVSTERIHVSCTSSICRAELTFTSDADFARALTIPADLERLRFARSASAPRNAVLYWDRDRDDVPF